MSEVCTLCGQGTLQPATVVDTFNHAGKPLQVADIEVSRCSHCGEELVTAQQYRKNQLRVADAKRRADGLLTSEEIRTIRKRHHISQAEASQWFGGGANAFSKYERGEVLQSMAMDTLLRLVDTVPGALDFIRARHGVVLP